MKKPRLACLAISALALAATAHASEPLKIGFVTTLSGPGAVIGEELRDGFALGIKHSGDKLGGLPVTLKLVDDQQSPDIARQALDRMIKSDKVDIVTGIAFSNVLLPVLPMILNSGTIYLSPNTGPADYAGAKCHKNFFATAWQNEDIPAAMGKFANEKKFNRVALIAPNYPGGRESLTGFKRLFKGEVSQELYSKVGQLDFSSELATLRAGKPDAVFFFLPGGTGVNFIKQFGAAGLGKQMALLAPGFSADEDTFRAVGPALLGTYNGSQWSPDLPGPVNKKFVEDFQKTYGRAPSMYASQGYDTALLIDGAVKTAGGKIEDRELFLKGLKAADFQSVRGAFKFNTNQYPIQNIYMRVVEKDSQGRITNRLLGTTLENQADAFVASCTMK